MVSVADIHAYALDARRHAHPSPQPRGVYFVTWGLHTMPCRTHDYGDCQVASDVDMLFLCGNHAPPTRTATFKWVVHAALLYFRVAAVIIDCADTSLRGAMRYAIVVLCGV